jgi:hypothetical protein
MRVYYKPQKSIELACQTQSEKFKPEDAEKTNGRWAMLGMIALLGAYSITHQIIPGIF